MTPTILLIRHANTALNDPGEERIRAYSDIPIDAQGKQHIEQAGKFLRDWDLRRILASPLQRAIMSADIIAEPHKAVVIPNRGFLPWDLGILQGELIKTAAKRMDYYQEYPDIKVPRGESYRDFYDRWSDCLGKLQLYAEQHPDEVVAAVTHSRNLLALPTIIGNRPIGEVPVKGGPPPASVNLLRKEGDSWTFRTIFEIHAEDEKHAQGS